MPNPTINQIKVGSTVYDIEDTTAQADIVTIQGAIDDINARIDDLGYEQIEFESFSITSPSGAKVEKGSTVSSITTSYKLNQNPVSLTIYGESVSGDPIPAIGTKTISGLQLTTNTTVNASATDAGSHTSSPHTATTSATLQFLFKAYTFAATYSGSTDSINSAFLNDKSGVLTATKNITFTVDAGTNQDKYIWYAIPASFEASKAAEFHVGGFTGGFLLMKTFNHINASGYAATSYNVYRSQYPNLGNTTVTVTDPT